MLWTEEALDAERLLREFPEQAKHSARYLKERNPRLYDAIALALSYGIPISKIEEQVKVSENTIRAVGFAETRSVEEGKEALKDNMRRFIRGAVSVLVEKMDEIPVEKLPVAIGIINQNLLLLEGSATQIIKHEQVASVDDITRAIEAAQRKANGRVVDEVPEIGSEAEKMPPTREGAGGRADVGSLTDSGPDAGALSLPSGSEALGESVQVVDNERLDAVSYRALYHTGPEVPGGLGVAGEGANGGGGGSSGGGGED